MKHTPEITAAKSTVAEFYESYLAKEPVTAFDVDRFKQAVKYCIDRGCHFPGWYRSLFAEYDLPLPGSGKVAEK